MASYGIEKFNKYFLGKSEVETYAKGIRGEDVNVFETVEGKTKIGTIKDGEPITVLVGDCFQKRYAIRLQDQIRYINDSNTGKPVNNRIKMGLARLKANDFIRSGKNVRFLFMEEEITCKEFTSKQQLADSIVAGLNRVRGVTENVRQTFIPWLKGNFGTIKWHENVDDEEKTRFGVYFGELFIGLLALSNKTAGYISPCPWKGKVGRFLIPTDPSFSGVDSFIEMEDGEIISISSKFGDGASASFFSNLLIKGLEFHDKLPSCIFKDIVDCCGDIGVTKQHLSKKMKSKEILYEYGIRNILGLDKKEVRDSYLLFEAIKKGEKTEEVELVSRLIAEREQNQRIVNLLAKSTTAFFSRETARLLNEDKVSIETMKEILAGKNFWQASLKIPEWKAGKIRYKMLNSGKAELELTGSKAAIGDAEAKQGMINYRLTFS